MGISDTTTSPAIAPVHSSLLVEKIVSLSGSQLLASKGSTAHEGPYCSDDFADLPPAFSNPRIATLTRRDSISTASDTGSDASGDSRNSYETIATGISTLQEASDNVAWSDDASDRWSHTGSNGYADVARSRRPSFAGSGADDVKAWQAVQALDIGATAIPGRKSSISSTASSEFSALVEQIHTSRQPSRPLQGPSNCIKPPPSRPCLSVHDVSSTITPGNPRRTQTRPIPSLTRQEDRRRCLVEQLVDAATELVAIIWPMSIQPGGCASKSAQGLLGLRWFVKEVLQRSKTSYNSLQVALWYLVKLAALDAIPACHDSGSANGDTRNPTALHCGRRMLLTSLIVASKYLQDRNFSAKAWSRISGLPSQDIIANELLFLNAIDHKLHVHDTKEFLPWSNIVMRCAEDIKLRNLPKVRQTWHTVLSHLRDGLDLGQIQSKIDTPKQAGSGMLAEVGLFKTPSHTPAPTEQFVKPALTPVHRDNSSAGRWSPVSSVRSTPAMPHVCPPAPRLDSRLATPIFTPQVSAMAMGTSTGSPAAYLSTPMLMQCQPTAFGPQRMRLPYVGTRTELPSPPASDSSDAESRAVRKGITRHASYTAAPFSPPISYSSSSSQPLSDSPSLDLLVEAVRDSESAQLSGQDDLTTDGDVDMSDDTECEQLSRFDLEQDRQEARLVRKRGGRAPARAVDKHAAHAREVAYKMKRKRSAKSSAESRRCAKAIRNVRQAQEATVFSGTSPL